MRRYNFLVILFFPLLQVAQLSAFIPHIPFSGKGIIIGQDTLKENQFLYNGKIWRNLYYQVHGNQFLFSNEFLSGSITITGKVFDNIDLKYDIFKDELLTPVDPGIILQFNKEMVDSFSFNFQNKAYRFIKLKDQNGQGFYYSVLYEGKTALYLKYYKKIEKLADEGQYDEFYQYSKLFFVKNNDVVQINGKSDLLNSLDDKKDLIKSFIKKNKLSVSEKVPESFIPILRYFDGLSQ